MGKKILIIGAGYAGIETALRLNKLKKKSDLEITIIDKNNYHTLLTELHEVAGNRVSEEAIRIPLHRIFKYTNINVVCDEITEYDFENNKVASSRREYTYDYLVLAIGSTPNFFGIKGLKENSFTLWSFDDAVRIREHIKKCFVLASSESDEQKRKAYLTLVVGGAGFTGVETVGELAHWIKSLAREYNINRNEIRLIILDVLPRILNSLSEKNAQRAHKYLETKLGVEVMLNTGIKEATADGIVTDSDFINTKTLIWACGVRASDDVEKMPIEKPNRSQRLKTDEFCRTKYENVYAAGDVSGLSDSDGREYPAMVENAIQTGEGVAKNILNHINGKELEKITVKLHGTMVSVGNFYTVSEIMGKILPVWLSFFMKYFVNMHYLWEITGFSGVARYIYHEVLERRQRKLFLEKHWSTRIQAWWLLPLRMFLGVMWLVEGIKKVNSDWLVSPKLASYLGYATDGLSSATPGQNLVKRYDEIFQVKLRIVDFLIGKETTMVTGEAISSTIYAKVDLLNFGDFNLVPWFLQNVVLANDGISMFFQILVVVLEIAVGLMFIGGAFTFIASIISLALMTMFLTSTGIYDKTWWMIFGSIATMGGAGRAFGIDYYLIPYLCNVWDHYWKNRKLKLFFKKSLDRPE